MSGERGESADYALEQPQVAKLLAACSTLEDKVLIGCQLWLGLRVSELVHTRADWITSEGNFRVPAQQKCTCSECLAKGSDTWRPKTRASIRTLPISSTLRKDLLEFLRQRPNGFQLSRQSLYYRTKTLLKKARIRVRGLADDTIFPHALRSTCAQMLALGGMSAAGLCAFMGWRSIAIGDHYIRASKAKELAMTEARRIFG